TSTPKEFGGCGSSKTLFSSGSGGKGRRKHGKNRAVAADTGASSGSNIVQRMTSDNGTTFDPVVNVTTDGNANFNPTLAAGDSGPIVTLFQSGSPTQIRSRTFTPGSGLGSIVNVAPGSNPASDFNGTDTFFTAFSNAVGIEMSR